MTIREIGILTDENISKRTVSFLRNLGLRVVDVKEMGWIGCSDREILNHSIQNDLWIMTHDSDFGTLTLHDGEQFKGIIYLRLSRLNPHEIETILSELFSRDLQVRNKMIIVVSDTKIRVRHFD